MRRVVQLYVDLDNVGDRLAPIITERLFGLEVERFDFERHTGAPPRGGVLAGLGSFLCNFQDLPLRIWGTGVEPGYLYPRYARVVGPGRHWRFHAVRGPMSRDLLHLSDAVPLGDPALLAPRFHTPRSVAHAPVRYFTHCENTEPVSMDEGVVVHSTRMDPLDAIDLVAASDFVFTEALHISVLAQAYGIPWAWSYNRHRAGIAKWYDWILSVGVPPRAFHHSRLADAMAWSKCLRRAQPLYDVAALLAAFPEDLIDE